MTPDIPFEEFLDRLGSKFNKNSSSLSMKFVEEDGGRVSSQGRFVCFMLILVKKVSLRDESDYELAIETARESARGKPDGKLVIYID